MYLGQVNTEPIAALFLRLVASMFQVFISKIVVDFYDKKVL